LADDKADAFQVAAGEAFHHFVNSAALEDCRLLDSGHCATSFRKVVRRRGLSDFWNAPRLVKHHFSVQKSNVP
jgi:hypothetical protein